uniref:Receptor expression-enhancing protein n=1 Tax=Coccolithus braarudii TaxID=221442 RepID=A0A7S0LSW1_9EUKA|mmetsp:Transcript_53374/g.114010  ORF Transcript_53374/g.114010 Transcript_53374/m.114010 type:complete len:217 (+) Transcript_53374:20-670(+)
MFFGSWSGPFAVVVLGFIRPAYSTFKALRARSADSSNAEADTVAWLVYWVVFSLFNLAELPLDLLISWVPLYYDLKVLFVLWLQLPYTQGAMVAYKGHLQPWLEKRQPLIDKRIEAVFGRLATLSLTDLQPTFDAAAEYVQQYVQQRELSTNSVKEMVQKRERASAEPTATQNGSSDETAPPPSVSDEDIFFSAAKDEVTPETFVSLDSEEIKKDQ